MARDRAMNNLAGRVLAVVVVEIWVMSRITEATSYVVGDSTGWSTPGNGASFYSSWASSHTFLAGDVLGIITYSSTFIDHVNLICKYVYACSS